jgi:serine/threonine protein kinase
MKDAANDAAPSHPDSDDPMIGSVVNGKFRILQAIAEGGMGRIYRGEQLPLGRPVAVKVLHAAYIDAATDPAFQKRFFLEASILSKLQHPNIVTVFDYGTIEGSHDDSCFMAMEYLPGDTLSQRLKDEGAFAPQHAVRVIRDIARGLREAHKAGIVHRDLKPGNLMLIRDEDGGELVKILDFGLVKVLERNGREDLTQDNSLLGSPRYMAPEQILMEEVDARADLYALGVIFYQLLTGKVPFEATTSVQILMKTVHDAVPAMADRVPGIEVPAPLEALVRRCLEKKPDARPPSSDAFLKELKAATRELGWISTEDSGSHSGARPGALSRSIAAASPKQPPGPTVAVPKSEVVSAITGSTTPPTPHSPRRKNPIIALAGAGGALLALLVGAALWWRVTPAPVPPPALPDAAVAPPPVAPPPAPTPFVLIVESLPAGAELFEGEARLGTTPIQLSIEPASVQTAPRSFTVKLAGHAPYSIVQGPSATAVRIVAPLVAEAAPVEKTPPPSKPKGGKRPGGGKPGRGAGDDIRLER